MTHGRAARLATATAVALATAGGLLTAAATQAAADSWHYPCYADETGFDRQFFPNTTFSGKAERSDCDPAINDNWGSGAPGIYYFPSNKFSVRWTKTRDFGSGGPFTFAASAQDGVRVYLDGVRKIDLWKDVSSTVWKSVNLTVPAGRHTIRVDFVNWTGNANVKFRWEPRTSASVDKVKPLSPYVYLAEYDQGIRATRLQWLPSPEMDLAGYRVYRRLPGSPWPAKPLVTTASPWYRDASVPQDGLTYYYDVRAVDRAGNESPARTGTPVTTVDRTAPVIKNLTASGGADWYGVALRWDEYEATRTSYELFRASSPSGPFDRLEGPMSGGFPHDYSLPHGETGYYKVALTDRAGNRTVSGVLAYTRPLAVPSLFARPNPERTGILLSWQVSTVTSGDFRVYRWNHEAAEAEPELITCDPQILEAGSSTSVVYGCTDTSAVEDILYGYRVVVVDGQGRESASNDDVAEVPDTTPPPAVTGLTATPTEYGTVLGWDPSDDPEVYRYRVWRNTTVPDTFPGGSGIAMLPATATGYTHVDAPNGQSWVYFVEALDQHGNSLFRLSPADTAHTTVTELDIRPPAEAVPAADSGWKFRYTWSQAKDGQARLDWTCSTDACAATGFNVLRWDREAGQFVPVTEQTLTADTRTWTDTTVPAGTTSYYVLEAVGADGGTTHSGVFGVTQRPVS